MNDFYPVVLHIYRKEVEPDKYVGMLDGIYRRGLTMAEVVSIVEETGVRIKKPYQEL